MKKRSPSSPQQSSTGLSLMRHDLTWMYALRTWILNNALLASSVLGCSREMTAEAFC